MKTLFGGSVEDAVAALATPPELAAAPACAAMRAKIGAGSSVQEPLEHVFRAMVERTLWARGVLAAEDVTGGIPEGATRHDPRSGLHERTASSRSRAS